MTSNKIFAMNTKCKAVAIGVHNVPRKLSQCSATSLQPITSSGVLLTQCGRFDIKWYGKSGRAFVGISEVRSACVLFFGCRNPANKKKCDRCWPGQRRRAFTKHSQFVYEIPTHIWIVQRLYWIYLFIVWKRILCSSTKATPALMPFVRNLLILCMHWIIAWNRQVYISCSARHSFV